MKNSTCELLGWLGGLWIAIVVIICVYIYTASCQTRPVMDGQVASTCMSAGTVILAAVFCSIPGIVLLLIMNVKWDSEEEYRNIAARGKVRVHVQATAKDLQKIDTHLRRRK